MNLHQATISMNYQPLLGQAADGPPLSDEGVATTGADGAGGTPAAGQQGGGGDFLLLMLIPMVVLMLVFSVFGQRKEKKKCN